MARGIFELDDEKWELFKKIAKENGTNATNLLRLFVEAVNAGRLTIGIVEVNRQNKEAQSERD